MIYKSAKTLRRAKKAFSLIELMIVIVIIGALTAIILPQFDVSEAEAKDTGCDASNYGTLSQLSKFRSINGAYPAKMHTGLETNATGAYIMGGSEDSNFMPIPSFTFYNMRDNTATVALTEDQVDSLKNVGIVSLAYGGFPVDSATAAAVAFDAVSESTYVKSIDKDDVWVESWNDANEDGIIQTTEEGTLSTTASPITINGIPLAYYVYTSPQEAFASSSSTTATDVSTEDGIVVPLFIAPTTDWEHWYDADGNQNDSKISVAQVGACPWLSGGEEFRYYIAIFKVYNNGDNAKLIGTMCPEGGSLNP